MSVFHNAVFPHDQLTVNESSTFTGAMTVNNSVTATSVATSSITSSSSVTISPTSNQLLLSGTNGSTFVLRRSTRPLGSGDDFQIRGQDAQDPLANGGALLRHALCVLFRFNLAHASYLLPISVLDGGLAGSVSASDGSVRIGTNNASSITLGRGAPTASITLSAATTSVTGPMTAQSSFTVCRSAVLFFISSSS